MTLYLSRDLRSLPLPWLPRAHAPLILHTLFIGESKPVPVYLLTPILYAALERQCDVLDAAHLAGQLSEDAIERVVERLACIQAWANEGLEWEQVRKARNVLAGHLDAANGGQSLTSSPLAWVVEQYIARMGGPGNGRGPGTAGPYRAVASRDRDESGDEGGHEDGHEGGRRSKHG